MADYKPCQLQVTTCISKFYMNSYLHSENRQDISDLRTTDRISQYHYRARGKQHVKV
jgi:hypothetical protein